MLTHSMFWRAIDNLAAAKIYLVRVWHKSVDWI